MSQIIFPCICHRLVGPSASHVDGVRSQFINHFSLHWEQLKYSEQDPLKTFFARFHSVAREFTSAGGVFDESEQVERLLMAMPEEYDVVVTVLETKKNTNLSLESVKSALLDHEIKLSMRKSKTSSVSSDNSAGAVAFYLNDQNQTQNWRSRLICYYCHKVGHKKNECPVLRRKNNQRQGGANVLELNDNSNDRPFSMLGSTTLLSRDTGSDDLFQFVIDSGCTDHIVNDRSLLIDITKLDTPIEVSVAESGKAMCVNQIGNVPLCNLVDGREINGVINKVLYAPQSRYNLLSVSRIE